MSAPHYVASSQKNVDTDIDGEEIESPKVGYTDEEIEQYRLQLLEHGHSYTTTELKAYVAQQQSVTHTAEDLEAYRQQVQEAAASGQYSVEELKQHEAYLQQEEEKLAQKSDQQQCLPENHGRERQSEPARQARLPSHVQRGGDDEPPSDPELAKRIDMMANFIVRNGTEFERMVMERNQGNEQFGFLFGKEGSGYFRATLKKLKDHNLSELVARYKEPDSFPVLTGTSAEEVHQLLMGLRNMASQDSIRNGRQFLMTTEHDPAQVVGEIRTFVGDKQACFDHRLHILYLVHDVLQYEVVQTEGCEITWLTAFRPYLVWLLRCGYCVAPNEVDREKVLKLLTLWQERKIVSGDEQADMKMLVISDLSKIKGVHATCAYISPEKRIPQQHPAPRNRQQPYMTNMQMGGFQPMALPVSAAQRPLCTPETIPVGVMSTMLKQISRRGRNWQTAFIPYKPLELAQTPQQLPAMEQPTPHLLARMQDFYDDLRSEDERGRSYSRTSSISSRSSSRSSRSNPVPRRQSSGYHQKPISAPSVAPRQKSLFCDSKHTADVPGGRSWAPGKGAWGSDKGAWTYDKGGWGNDWGRDKDDWESDGWDGADWGGRDQTYRRDKGDRQRERSERVDRRDRERGRTEGRGRRGRDSRSRGRDREASVPKATEPLSDVDMFRKQCAARIAAGWQDRVARDGEVPRRAERGRT